MEIELPVKEKVFSQNLELKENERTDIPNAAKKSFLQSSSAQHVTRNLSEEMNGNFTSDQRKLHAVAAKKTFTVNHNASADSNFEDSHDCKAEAVTPVIIPPGHKSETVETMHRKIFSRKDDVWRLLLATMRDRVERALLRGISNATALPLRNIRVVSMNVDEKLNLVTEFALIHDVTKSAAAMDDALDAYHFDSMKSILRVAMSRVEGQNARVAVPAFGTPKYEKYNLGFSNGHNAADGPRVSTKRTLNSTASARREKSFLVDKKKGDVESPDVHERSVSGRANTVPKNKRRACVPGLEIPRKLLTPQRHSRFFSPCTPRRAVTPTLVDAQCKDFHFLTNPRALLGGSAPRHSIVTRSPRRCLQGSRSPSRTLLSSRAAAVKGDNCIERGVKQPIPPQRVVRMGPAASVHVGSDSVAPTALCAAANLEKKTVAAFFKKHVDRRIITGSPVRKHDSGEICNEDMNDAESTNMVVGRDVCKENVEHKMV